MMVFGSSDSRDVYRGCFRRGRVVGFATLAGLLLMSGGLGGCAWVRSLMSVPVPVVSPAGIVTVGPRVYVTDASRGVIALSCKRTGAQACGPQFVVEGGAGAVGVSPDNRLLYATADKMTYVRVYGTDGTPRGRIETGKGPSAMVLTAGGKHAYVVNRGDDTLGELDLVARKQVRSAPAGKDPISVCLSCDGRRVYVLLHRDHRVVAYNAASLQQVGEASVGVDPFGMAVDPGGKFLYVTSFDSNRVDVLDSDTLKLVTEVRTDDGPYQVIATRGGEIYVTCMLDGSVVSFKRGEWGKDARRTKVGIRPYGLAASPDGSLLYVALEGERRVKVLSLPDMVERDTVDVGMAPVGLFSGR